MANLEEELERYNTIGPKTHIFEREDLTYRQKLGLFNIVQEKIFYDTQIRNQDNIPEEELEKHHQYRYTFWKNVFYS